MKASQIKKDIQSKVVVGLNGVGEDTKELFKEVLQSDYYDAYKPKEYSREWVMPHEVQKSFAQPSGSGGSVEIYYDAGAGGHVQPKGYSEEEILDAVMWGYHMKGMTGAGDVTDNTWFNTLAEFDAKKDEIIPRNLRAAGLPVH